MQALCAVLLTGMSLAGLACEDLDILDAWVREPPPNAGVAAAFMTFRNRGLAPLQITQMASASFASAAMHETVTSGDHVHMASRKVVPIAAGEKVKFEPGGLHVMLMQPNRPLIAGMTVPLEVTCETGTRRFDLVIKRD
ncbi:MAG: copper chaperone PCu(A)C [Gammaproteobacteria bacterium]|nr:copper chaperone PCu(A)C [Gammaproteobacteria bacterium]